MCSSPTRKNPPFPKIHPTKFLFPAPPKVHLTTKKRFSCYNPIKTFLAVVIVNFSCMALYHFYFNF